MTPRSLVSSSRFLFPLYPAVVVCFSASTCHETARKCKSYRDAGRETRKCDNLGTQVGEKIRILRQLSEEQHRDCFFSLFSLLSTTSEKKTRALLEKNETNKTKNHQPCLGAFNTESSSEAQELEGEEREASSSGGGDGIGDLVAQLLGRSSSPPSSSAASPCPPSAPLRDSSGTCVPAPSRWCSSGQPHCASCDATWQGPEGFASCSRCLEGYFAFSSAFVFGGGEGSSGGGFGASTAGARSCLSCSSLRCSDRACADGKGCSACPQGLMLERKCASCPLSCLPPPPR